MQTNPFKRSAAMFQAISAILSRCGGNSIAAQNEISALGSYHSKGKGGKRAHTTGHKHMANVRRARKAHNIAKRK